MTIPDTHAYIKRLEQAGFTEDQAEAQVTIWLDWIKADLATKQDLKETEIALCQDMKAMESGIRQDMKAMESSLRQDMKAMESGIRQDMKDMEIRLLHTLRGQMKWTVGLLFLQAGLIVALIKLLPGPTG